MALARCIINSSRIVSTTYRLFSKKPSKDALGERKVKIIVPEKKLVKNILEWYVDPSKTFSQYTWSDMQEQFSLEDPITGNILPKIHDVNQDCVDNVLTQWEKFRSKIKSFPGNNESECTHYIAVMLDSLPNVDNVRLALEYRVTDTVITGYLDYAFVTSKGLFSSVISVIEAKHVGIVKGRAQNYVQLLACYDLARKSYCKCMADHKIPSVLEKQLLEEFPLCIYGVISTVTEWVFVRFDGKEWLETNVIFIKPNFEDDREHVEKVRVCKCLDWKPQSISDCVFMLEVGYT